MDILIGLGVVALVAFIAYKKVPAVKARIDGLLNRE